MLDYLNYIITCSILVLQGISKGNDIHENPGLAIYIINFTGVEKFGSS